ncbi:hypothetical protein WJX74_000821 [Apatococcus lobatus]|uniref:YEATS domain-containing protein n=1 Tax=Apatococcus lobatus TaxID=904363 RepID=A0AAW1S518_9CHLO
MAGDVESTFTGSKGEKRLKGVEVVYPIVTGTVAFFLGKKATGTASHKWTVYVRGLKNEDLSHVIKKVTFYLHPSFNNPARDVTESPFEVNETGWGEFEINIKIYFHDEAFEDPIEILHHLRLYADNDGGSTAQQSTKKPVVTESYDELVFNEPAEAFHSRWRGHDPAPAKDSQAAPFFLEFAPQQDLDKINALRRRIAQQKAGLLQQFEAPMS